MSLNNVALFNLVEEEQTSLTYSRDEADAMSTSP